MTGGSAFQAARDDLAHPPLIRCERVVRVHISYALGDEVWETLGLPVDLCKRYVDHSELMKIYRTALFTRIVPTIKDIGLWGPRVRKAYAEMGIIGFADGDIDVMAARDEEIAAEFDRRGKEVREVAGLAGPQR